jgi:hypothetical protein
MKNTSQPLMVTYACGPPARRRQRRHPHAKKDGLPARRHRTVSISVISVGYSSIIVGAGAAIATRLGAARASYNGPEALHHVLAASRGVA